MINPEIIGSKHVTLIFWDSDETLAHHTHPHYLKTLLKQYTRLLVGTQPHSSTLT